jgi:hypothetical protein
MGRMKEVYIQIMNENGGIPKDMTIGDIARMRDLEIYNWQEYEREQEKRRLQLNQQEDSRKIREVQQAEKEYSKQLREKKDKQ